MTGYLDPEEFAPTRRLWSVTTLIKEALGTSEGLVRWNVGQACEAAYDGVDTLQTFVSRGERDAAVKWLQEARWHKTNKAKARGTDIHSIVEKMTLGEEPEVPEHLAPYVEQYRRWRDAFAPAYLMAEAPVYNIDYGYAGTLDGILELNGQRLIYDYKTTEHLPDSGKSRPPFPEVALQLAAYAHATEVGVLSEQRYEGGKRYYVYDPTAHHEPLPEVDGALCIVISPGDCFAVPVRIDDYVWGAFTQVRYVAQFVLDSKDQALFGPPLPAPQREEQPA
jgi:hypothetical protein